MIDIPKVVMLNSNKRNFYISSAEIDDIKSMRFLDQKMIQSIMVENDDFVKVIDLEGVTILPVTLEDYISEIEQELSPRCIMTLSLKFEDGIVIYFQTGELSIFAEDTHLISPEEFIILHSNTLENSTSNMS